MTLAKPKIGDKIYVPGFLHVTHGVDDFWGGVCTVTGVRDEIFKGEPRAFVSIAEDPDSWINWDTFLAPMQEQLRKEFGAREGRRHPDNRPEFNE